MANFSDFNLSEPISRAIEDLGYLTPSPIQAETLPILLGEPTDFLGLAATGTGKTAAFSIPILERIQPSLRGIQALILCPTRELALQVATQVSALGIHKGIKALPIYGGSGFADQLHGLKRGAQVVVGTPGRVLDHLERGTLHLKNLKTLVLDEADEMLSMGFKEEIDAILDSVPAEDANTWLFSATMAPGVKRLADDRLRSPKKIQVNRTEMVPKTVEQVYFITQESNKPEVLCKLIDAAPDFYGIIFCQTKALVNDLTQYLLGRNYRTDCLHGDMEQNARERTMKAFRERKVSILVATDVACRGLDVKEISHVVNYSIPRELDNYVHRIGRTGRIGNQGLAYSLVTQSHRGLIGRIENLTKTRMKEGRIPSRKEIGAKKLAKSLETFSAITPFSRARAEELMSEEWKTALTNLTKEEIAASFLSQLFPEVFAVNDVLEPSKSAGSLPIIKSKGTVSTKSPVVTGRGPVPNSGAKPAAPYAGASYEDARHHSKRSAAPWSPVTPNPRNGRGAQASVVTPRGERRPYPKQKSFA